MLLNLPSRSLEAFVEAEESDGSRHDRLDQIARGKSQIPQMLATTAHYQQESGHIRAALARMHTTHREGRRSA